MINKNLSCLQITLYDNKVWHEKKKFLIFLFFITKIKVYVTK